MTSVVVKMAHIALVAALCIAVTHCAAAIPVTSTTKAASLVPQTSQSTLARPRINPTPPVWPTPVGSASGSGQPAHAIGGPLGPEVTVAGVAAFATPQQFTPLELTVRGTGGPGGSGDAPFTAYIQSNNTLTVATSRGLTSVMEKLTGAGGASLASDGTAFVPVFAKADPTVIDSAQVGVSAVSPAGKQLWRAMPADGSSLFHPVLSPDEKLVHVLRRMPGDYFSLTQTFAVALNASTGDTVYSLPAGTAMAPPPRHIVLSNGQVAYGGVCASQECNWFLGTMPNLFFAPLDPVVLFNTTADLSISTQGNAPPALASSGFNVPTVGAPTLVVTSSYSVASMSMKSGGLVWVRTLPYNQNSEGFFLAPPAVGSAGRVFVCTWGELIALNATSGDILWRVDRTATGPARRPIIDWTGHIFLTSGNFGVTARSIEAGAQLWTTQLPFGDKKSTFGTVMTMALPSDGVLLVALAVQPTEAAAPGRTYLVSINTTSASPLDVMA